jgi:hypothetical protein
MEAHHHPTAVQRHGSRAKRVVLSAGIALATLNIFTGAPMLGLWVGSRVQSDGPPTAAALLVVVLVMGAAVLGLVRLIAVLQSAHDKLTGGSRSVREHTPWLRSMRGERPRYPGEPAALTAPERVLVAVAVLGIGALEVWFFFFSGSPIDQRSGRGAVPMQVAKVAGYAAPPAIAGRMTTVSPAVTPVSRPCCTRTSSSFT